MARVPFAKANTVAPGTAVPAPDRADTTLAVPTPLQLVQTEAHLELRDGPTGACLWVEFTPADVRAYRGGRGPDPLRRAIGPGPRTIVDATAGLGYDAVHLAVLGYRVTAIERNVVVGALACDGLARARGQALIPPDNPTWQSGDTRTLLPTFRPPPDTVYLDPMYPPKRKKSAAVRKEMRLLRLLVADDDDAAELLAVARACAADRVVVKRPLDAPALAPGVTAAYAGKLVRYDVYRTVRSAKNC